MKKTLVLLLVLGFGGTALGQSADVAQIEEANRATALGIKPAVSPFSLIDLSRVKWSHSYSVSFFSGGNYSGSTGLFRTNMFYEFSSKLSLSVNLGIAHNTGAVWGDGATDATLLPGFMLDYHPSEKFRLSIGFQRFGGYVSPFYYRPAFWDYPLGR
jgi:hypothetical protein